MFFLPTKPGRRWQNGMTAVTEPCTNHSQNYIFIIQKENLSWKNALFPLKKQKVCPYPI